jgi:hypothetical protein
MRSSLQPGAYCIHQCHQIFFKMIPLCNRIYQHKFAKQLSSSGGSSALLPNVLGALKGPSSKLAEKTRRELPTTERVETTFRNINWLLCYWMCTPPAAATLTSSSSSSQWDYNACYPDPISPEYGFAMVKKKNSTQLVVQWLDANENTD